MRILIQLSAKPLRDGKENPKNYPKDYCDSLLESLKNDIIININERQYSLEELEKEIEMCDLFISVDSMLQHLCWYHGKKGITIFSQSDPEIFGHEENINLLKDKQYLREHQFEIWEAHEINKVEYNKEAFVTSSEIIDVINNNFRNIWHAKNL